MRVCLEISMSRKRRLVTALSLQMWPQTSIILHQTVLKTPPALQDFIPLRIVTPYERLHAMKREGS